MNPTRLLALCLTCTACVAFATNFVVRAKGASLAAILQAAMQESASLALARRVMQAQPESWHARSQDAEQLPDTDVVAVRAEWRRWQAQLPALSRSARRGSYDLILQRYHAARQAFWDAFSLANIHAMSLAFSDAELFLAQLRALFPPDNAPPDVPRLPEPDDMRRAYRTALYTTRTNWIAGLHCDAAQANALHTIFRARSLADHTTLLDHVATAAWPTVTLTWLGRVYQDLAWQEPYVFAYWYGWGNARALLGDRAGANHVWRAALRYFPDTLYVRYHFARTCGSTPEEHRRAIRQFEWITTATKDPLWRVKAYCHMARRYLACDDYAQALEAAQRAVATAQSFHEELAPWLIEAWRLQSTAWLRRGQPDQAAQALEQAVTTFPTHTALKRELADLLYGLALAHETNTSYAARAIQWYEKTLREAGESTDILGRQAQLLLLLGRAAEARNAAVRQLALDPSSPAALTTIGWTYVSDGDNATARIFFRKALDVNASYAPARDALAALPE
ncbi:MAG: hypothetical protein N2595_08750 [bacterium]|nr:hypothetical protein [bacterium]